MLRKTLGSLFAVFLALLATGCATSGGYSSPFGDITKLTNADLDAALADATAHGDKAAMACYPVLKSVIANLPAQVPAAPPAGIVSAFQAARDASKAVQSGVTSGQNAIVQEVNLGCAALFNDTQGDILRLGVIFRP